MNKGAKGGTYKSCYFGPVRMPTVNAHSHEWQFLKTGPKIPNLKQKDHEILIYFVNKHSCFSLLTLHSF